MNTHTDIQIIHDKNGVPAYVVIPYNDWISQQDREKDLVPNEVVHMVFEREWTPMRAWREHLGLTQADVAKRANISQAAYAQMESTEKPRFATIRKIAAALGITPAQLEF